MSDLKKVISIELDDNTKTGLENVDKTFDKVDNSIKNATKTSANLRLELRQLQKDLLSGKFTGEEFTKATQRAGELKDTIGDLNSRINTLSSDTKNLDALVSAATGIAAGFSIAQGAAGLFGDESEELQQSLLKVQSAMAILNGLTEIQNLLQGESKVAILATTVAQKIQNFVLNGTTTATVAQTAATEGLTVATNTAVVASRALRVALLATGIGAIVVLIVSLVSAMNDYTQSTKDAEQAQKDFNNQLELSKQFADDEREAIEYASQVALANARKRGASDKEMRQIELNGIEETIKSRKKETQDLKDKLNKEQGLFLSDLKKKEEIKARYEALQKEGANSSFIESDIVKAKRAIATAKAQKAYLESEYNFSVKYNEKTFAKRKETNDKILEQIKEGDKAVQNLDRERQIKKANWDADDAEKSRERIENRNKKEHDLYLKGIQDYLTTTKDSFDRQHYLINNDNNLTLKEKKAFNKKIADADAAQKEAIADKQLADDMASAQQAIDILNQLKEDAETPAERELREYNDKRKVLLDNNLSIEELTRQHIKKMQQIQAEDLERQQIVTEAKIGLRNAELDATIAAFNIAAGFAKRGSDLQKALIIAEKSATIAKIIMNTMAANTADYAYAATLGPYGAAYLAAKIPTNYTQMGIGIATTIAAAAQALSSLGGGSAGGGGSTGGGAAAPPAQFNIVGQSSTNQLAGTIANRQQQPLRAYVVGNDVSTQQELDRNRIQNSTFL